MFPGNRMTLLPDQMRIRPKTMPKAIKPGIGSDVIRYEKIIAFSLTKVFYIT